VQKVPQGLKDLGLCLRRYGPTEEAAEKVNFEKSRDPQGLKPGSLHSSYVRPEGRTLPTKASLRGL
jgi:hypothetical protein